MNEPFPYVACPNCESQLLNPTIEDGMYHFICHECGSGVWVEIEESEEEKMDKMKLYAHIDYCLRACAKAVDYKEVWLHQAFGAAQYHIIIHPEDEGDVVRHWNERDKPTFEQLIYGKSITL